LSYTDAFVDVDVDWSLNVQTSEESSRVGRNTKSRKEKKTKGKGLKYGGSACNWYSKEKAHALSSTP
jgi:hypothetical protein